MFVIGFVEFASVFIVVCYIAKPKYDDKIESYLWYNEILSDSYCLNLLVCGFLRRIIDTCNLEQKIRMDDIASIAVQYLMIYFNKSIHLFDCIGTLDLENNDKNKINILCHFKNNSSSTNFDEDQPCKLKCKRNADLILYPFISEMISLKKYNHNYNINEKIKISVNLKNIMCKTNTDKHSVYVSLIRIPNNINNNIKINDTPISIMESKVLKWKRFNNMFTFYQRNPNHGKNSRLRSQWSTFVHFSNMNNANIEKCVFGNNGRIYDTATVDDNNNKSKKLGYNYWNNFSVDSNDEISVCIEYNKEINKYYLSFQINGDKNIVPIVNDIGMHGTDTSMNMQVHSTFDNQRHAMEMDMKNYDWIFNLASVCCQCDSNQTGYSFDMNITL